MPCYGPLTGYYPKTTSNDKRLVFRKDKSETGVAIKIPCGRCSGCRLEHSRQWAVRCMHEKRLHSNSCFITLTYDNDHLPSGGTLIKSDLQNFMKGFRRFAGNGVRFFACGEYGEKSLRPHYHVLILSHTLPDLRKHSGGEMPLYTSKTLDKMWNKGFAPVGEVTFESCAYVARYCMKKITGPKADAHYKGRSPEFIVMSRRPGLGAGYFDKYAQEIIDHDNIIVNGHAAALPRFYDGKLAGMTGLQTEWLHTGIELIKAKRRRKLTRASRLDNTTTRLRVREVVAMAKLNQKVRKI